MAYFLDAYAVYGCNLSHVSFNHDFEYPWMIKNEV